jgi:hypothetical protein
MPVRGPNPGVEWNGGVFAHLYEIVHTLDGYEIHYQGDHRAGPLGNIGAAEELARWLPDPARYFIELTEETDDDDDPGF